MKVEYSSFIFRQEEIATQSVLLPKILIQLSVTTDSYKLSQQFQIQTFFEKNSILPMLTVQHTIIFVDELPFLHDRYWLLSEPNRPIEYK